MTVNKPESSVDQSKELLKNFLAILTPAVPAPARAPEPSSMDKLFNSLKTHRSLRPLRRRPNQRSWKRCSERISGGNSCQVSSPDSDWYDVTGLMLSVFSCGKTGHSATRCQTLDVTFPFILPGWKAEKTSIT